MLRVCRLGFVAFMIFDNVARRGVSISALMSKGVDYLCAGVYFFSRHLVSCALTLSLIFRRLLCVFSVSPFAPVSVQFIGAWIDDFVLCESLLR